MNDLPANVAAGTSVVTAWLAWFALANEVLQFVALIVSITAGIYAIAHYRRSTPKR